MPSARIKWDHRRLALLLRQRKVSDDMYERAKRIAAACNAQSDDAGYLALRSTRSRRGRAAVVAVRTRARVDNAENNRMLRNLDEGR